MNQIVRKMLGSCILQIKYIISQIQVALKGKKKKSEKIIASYKNKYKGQRCFVIGNGPSLNKEDLEMLKDEVTFASNRIYKMFDETDWRPTFFTMFDEGVAKREGVVEGINTFECEMHFVRSQGYTIYKKIKEPICYLYSWWSRKYLRKPEFSDDLSKGIYTIATVTYAMIEIAAYMGFEKIYLLGVDHKYHKTVNQDGSVCKDANVKSYFGNQKEEEKSVVAATWEMEIAYQYAENYSRTHGFRIYNATRGGYLEVFERVNLDEVLEKSEEEI